jgi:hypothetical protein
MTKRVDTLPLALIQTKLVSHIVYICDKEHSLHTDKMMCNSISARPSLNLHAQRSACSVAKRKDNAFAHNCVEAYGHRAAPLCQDHSWYCTHQWLQKELRT